MPIYEFYCSDCHKLFHFLARSVHTRRRPDCPKCGRKRLPRKPSRFAVSRGLAEPADDGMPDSLDDAAMERAMEAIAAEAQSLDEDDPRQAARLMRRLYDASGMPMERAVEEAIRRMESGEDPDRIEEELGDAFDDSEGADASTRIRSLARRALPPSVDSTLYEL